MFARHDRAWRIGCCCDQGLADKLDFGGLGCRAFRYLNIVDTVAADDDVAVIPSQDGLNGRLFLRREDGSGATARRVG